MKDERGVKLVTKDRSGGGESDCSKGEKKDCRMNNENYKVGKLIDDSEGKKLW